MAWFPLLAVELAVIVMFDVPEPGAGMEVGAKLAVTPDGRPDADRAIAESKPPEAAVVIVVLAGLPLVTAKMLGAAEMLKLPVTVEVTVRVTVTVCVMPPPVPETVIGYTPVAV